jgi:predicted transcriptional regulator
MPAGAGQAEILVRETVEQRLRHSALTNVSRAVSELVRAGLVRRHYQGYRVDHHNRGAQRQAVYSVTEEALRALT